MTVVTNNTIQPSSGQALTIKDEGGTASITVATNGEATFAENIKITNGKGIDFSAVSGSASGSASAVLDDYEEGTFEAGLACDTGTLNTDSSQNLMSYIKIGRVVHVHGQVKVASDVSSPTGDASLTGLPFTSASGSEGSGLSAVSTRIYLPQGTTGSMTNSYIGPSSTTIVLRQLSSSGTDTGLAPAMNNVGTYLMIQATYFSA